MKLSDGMVAVPCSVLLSNNYVIVEACSKNIMGSTNLAYSQKSQAKSSCQIFFKGLPLFHGKEKLAESSCPTTRCFIHPPLIFATQRLIVSVQHITLCISLLSQSLSTWYYLMSWKILYYSESYFAEVVCKNLHS